MSRSFSYQDTDEGGIQFITKRKIGDVRIPNYVYDMWMPIIGSDAIGVYAVYCRLEMHGAVKKMTLSNLAAAGRIGVKKLNSINEKLEKCGFVKVSKPTGSARLMHWTTKIEVYDPPQEVSKELIDEFCSGDYDLLTPWFKDQKATPEKSKGNSDETKGHLDKSSKGNSNIAALDMQPLRDVKGAPEKNDYLSTLANHTTGKETVAQPDDFQQHFGYRDEFLRLYNDLLGRLPSQVEKEEIVELAHQSGANVKRWERSIRETALNWAGNSRTPPLQRIIEVYRRGGDYEKWRQWKYPTDQTENKNRRPRLEFVNQITGEVTVYDSK